MEELQFDKTSKKVIYNGKKVDAIVGCNIYLDDDTTVISKGRLSFEIADFWKEQVEKDCVLAPKVDFTLDECLEIAGALYKGKYVRVEQLFEKIYEYKKLQESTYIRSNYDPRDNDYNDSTYTACIFRQDFTILETFIQIMVDNGYIDHTTSTTIYFRNIEPKYEIDDFIDMIKLYAKGKYTPFDKEIKDTCIASKSGFIAWHINKYYPNATVDKLKELGWDKFYELNKDNIINKREYFRNKEENASTK